MVKMDSPPPPNGNGKVAGLPIISITPYLLDETSRDDIQERRAATSSALHRACRDFGFFYLDISAFADPRESDELAKLGRAFFSLPQEEKDRLALKNEDYARGMCLTYSLHVPTANPDPFPLLTHTSKGYQRLRENVTNGLADNHEGIDFYRPVDHPDKSKPLWGTNQWPTVPGFREKYEAWVDKMKRLGMIVMEAYVLHSI
jgi:isopenicillin N synthase-like dioxygenase